ncbi:MAG: GntR family transcriptional regulator [Proteobacteria bacterium]|nr:GntR family transcriptional regulator [Pseudomonadota bacterium]MBI3495999.1 GntR family transcriptional regulator [Pseudomonadota bacterium]
MPKKRNTLSDEVIRSLEEEILRGVLKPGERLDEAELSQRFGVSRTPVRDALRHLAASELVDIRPHQSAVVATLTIPRLIEMFEVMAELEGMCARLACGRIRGEQQETLKQANADCAAALETGDIVRFYAANNRFHETIYEAAGNRFLREQTIQLRNRLSPYRRQVTYQPGRMKASIVEHDRIMSAIQEMKPLAADQAMRFHLELLGSGVSDFVSNLDIEAGGDGADLLPFASSLG